MPAPAAIGSEVLVNTATTGNQTEPVVAALADGGFVVAWTTDPDGSFTGDIRAQRFDADGNKVGGEISVNTTTSQGQNQPAVLGLSAGGFVLVWNTGDTTLDSDPNGVIGQVFDAAGGKVGNEFLVNATTAQGQSGARLDELADGKFMVTWFSGDASVSTTVKARVFSDTGVAQGGEVDVTSSASRRFYPDIATLENGHVVIAWEDTGSQVADGVGATHARILDAAGNAVGSEITVNTTPGEPQQTAVAALSGGGFVVSWYLGDSEEGAGGGVMAQVFDADGAKVGGEIVVRTGGSGPSVTGTADGGFMVSYTEYASTGADTDGSSVWAQLFDAAGVAQGSAVLVNTTTAADQSEGAVATLDDGNIVVAWQSGSDFPNAATPADVHAQLVEGPGGGSNPDPNETFDLSSAPGMTAIGGPGDDIFIVDDAQDSPVENAGEGTDTVQSAIAWTLGDNFENLEITGAANSAGTGNALPNHLTGNGGANSLNGGDGIDTLDGGGGNDLLNGGNGADVLRGGAGNDTYVVGFGDTVTEMSAQGTDTVRSAIRWTLGPNVENLLLTGSSSVNGTGNGGANALTGNGAANTLAGLGANDTLTGVGGADVLNGGDGNDVLKGGAGNDTLTGGIGSDAFVFDTALNASANSDRIADFKPATDKIRLDHDVFTQLAVGSLAAGQFVKGAGLTAAQDGNDRIVYNTSTGALFYDADGAGGSAAVKFAVLGSTTHPALTAADFVIIT